jgi:hypothetical protein
MKDIDSFIRSLYLRIFFWFLYPSLFIGLVALFFTGSLKILFAALVVTLVAPIPLSFVINRSSGILGSLYSGRSSGATLEEQLAGELTKGRHLKTEKRFTEALQTVNLILEQMPEHAETLLLKAQILSEGFANDRAAKDCLKKILRLDESISKETTRQWAKGMLDDIEERLQ